MGSEVRKALVHPAQRQWSRMTLRVLPEPSPGRKNGKGKSQEAVFMVHFTRMAPLSLPTLKVKVIIPI